MDRILRSTAAKIAVAIAASALAVLVASSGIIMAVLWNEGFLRGSADDVRRNMAERLLQRDAYHAYEETLGASDMYEIYDSETSPSFDSDEAMAESAAKEWRKLIGHLSFPETRFNVEVNGHRIYTGDKNIGKNDYTGTFEHMRGEGDRNIRITITAVYAPSKDGGQITQLLSITDFIYANRYAIIVLDFIGLAVVLILVGMLIAGAGRRPEDDEIHDRRIIDHIPQDVYLLGLIVVITIFIALLEGIVQADDVVGSVIICMIFGFAGSMLATCWLMSLAVQVKQKRMLRETLCGRVLIIAARCLRTAGRTVGLALRAIPLTWKLLVPAGAITALTIITALASSWDAWGVGFVFLLQALGFALIWYLATVLSLIQKGTSHITSGDTGYEIDTYGMVGAFKEHAESLNNINRAIDAAVSERIKSEHLKTELITNVSHDIKTPLTSIINYTDLLAAEELENEKAEEYINIISSNAMRLKKLATDVVDASKASTGNVSLDLEECSLGMMVEQVLGEYSDRLAQNNLTPVVNIPSDDILVWADGKHSWRILDNILNNIVKYAQQGTRVYIDVENPAGAGRVSLGNGGTGSNETAGVTDAAGTGSFGLASNAAAGAVSGRTSEAGGAGGASDASGSFESSIRHAAEKMNDLRDRFARMVTQGSSNEPDNSGNSIGAACSSCSNTGRSAQPSARSSSGMAYICFRNISAAELNISSDELMERFIRGDASRNTEGSGLGLSIAGDLAKIQGGSLDVTIDGDLFKVRVGFIRK